jgi:hypothetical protein
MRSEQEVREHLDWLQAQCRNFNDDEAIAVIRQLETLLWILGHEREKAAVMAAAIWEHARDERRQRPRDYS